MAIFDKEAKGYDQWYSSKLGEYVDLVETNLAFELLQPKAGMKILDVGCGTGNFSVKLAEMGCQVLGIDLSKEMLEVARGKIRPGLDLDFRQMDVYQLDFADEEFDGVISMAAFEFIKQPDRAYGEMYRVLKNDGPLLIGTINKESSWGELYLSDEMQAHSVFKYADLKTQKDLSAWNPVDLVKIDSCLFLPPQVEEDMISLERERELASQERGGFLCALWKKEI